MSSLESHASTVWSIAFDASGNRLASVGDDKCLKIWQRYRAAAADAAADADDSSLLPPQQDSTPLIGSKDAEPWKCVCTVSGCHDRAVFCVSWCHLTGLLATAAGDNAIRVFRENEEAASTAAATPDGRKNAPSFDMAEVRRRAHDEDVNAVAWNPRREGLLASVGDEGVVKLWRFSA